MTTVSAHKAIPFDFLNATASDFSTMHFFFISTDNHYHLLTSPQFCPVSALCLHCFDTLVGHQGGILSLSFNGHFQGEPGLAGVY